MESTFKLSVNGRERSVTSDPRRPLLDVLREDLELTGEIRLRRRAVRGLRRADGWPANFLLPHFA